MEGLKGPFMGLPKTIAGRWLGWASGPNGVGGLKGPFMGVPKTLPGVAQNPW